jgi:hypothetical protein
MNEDLPPISEKEMRKLMSKALIKVGELLAAGHSSSGYFHGSRCPV